jgi:hypothetical protein
MNKSSTLTYIRIGSVLGFILMFTINALAVILPINGQNTGAISDKYPNLFTPAGITFSIWGIIYLFLLLYTIYQTGLIWKATPQQNTIVHRIGGLYILTCIFNAAWILCWHYDLVALSVVVMLLLLTTLIFIYLRIRDILKHAVLSHKKWLVMMPFSLYLGWITVATIANATALLVFYKWDGFGIGPVIWTILLLCIAATITMTMLGKFKDYAYSIVVIWAVLGIFIKHVTIFKMDYIAIIVTTVIVIAVILIGIVMTMKRSGKSIHKGKSLKKISHRKKR